MVAGIRKWLRYAAACSSLGDLSITISDYISRHRLGSYQNIFVYIYIVLPESQIQIL